ncbi:DNA adenine methylase [Pluralibacter gergoviae]|uniref:Site-specific DNA-methyltransferase (adenine-specific) n=1 Tax=Pluralibacter gergoviae TaxID=61647 RepID=A0AAI9DQE3_PLUGE|nr:DNA adenine methylase [Pluralibacter gergoviae]EKV0917664.1 DNA adenine methylase [Pluralibacter gergoviae]EKV9910691.1 DNA adenine methylase [Pluralibacter gergoviae]EKW7275900.1 DNA adenine methylase [Pluralibacter gergoviae]ELD4298081.1 DNA adenine methylase [Pluralibacter gergoviae]ELD4308826.1 DNA adenine methylase [Pluralibacter gergoviae]
MAVKSPLKWVGSKARLMPQLRPHLPEGRRLVEPFAGSCSVMLNTDYDEYLIADVNPDLVNLYRAMAYHPTEFIRELEFLFAAGLVGEKAERESTYYAVRERFNQSASMSHIEKAAAFLYMNRFGYGGACRYNQRGHFNIPCGKYEKPYLPEAEIRVFSEKARRATFICASYEETLKMVRAGDVVYCDPPYIPVTPTANFTQYHTDGFTAADQEYLSVLLFTLSNRGIPVIASNSDTSQARGFYSCFNLHQLEAPRSIGAKNGADSSVQELLIRRGV